MKHLYITFIGWVASHMKHSLLAEFLVHEVLTDVHRQADIYQGPLTDDDFDLVYQAVENYYVQ